MSKSNRNISKNTKHDNFVNKFNESQHSFILKDISDDLTKRCKFNFSYFDASQGTTFFNLTIKQQKYLFDVIIDFSKKSLSLLEAQGRFHNYHEFPSPEKTKFTPPKDIPNDVCWCRFRLSGTFRLIGFIVPEHLHNKNPNEQKDYLFDKNTFYVVFIDPDHQFWIPSKPSKK
jgi:hypothetical protein